MAFYLEGNKFHFTLVNGNELDGVISENWDDGYWLKLDDGSKFMIAKHAVLTMALIDTTKEKALAAAARGAAAEAKAREQGERKIKKTASSFD